MIFVLHSLFSGFIQDVSCKHKCNSVQINELFVIGTPLFSALRFQKSKIISQKKMFSMVIAYSTLECSTQK